ncbi:hypothetical protein C8R46DRAFT_1188756 [Mycena filopes]|nr:hypothetical protein C8R46DRAFT_1188756 [Mycena filopes]
MYFLPAVHLVFFLLAASSATAEAEHQLSRRSVPTVRRQFGNAPLSRMTRPSPRQLVPFSDVRRSHAHHTRAMKRALLPKSTLHLAYGHEAVSYPSTTLKFSAHPNTPMISLEEIDHLLTAVRCESGSRTHVPRFSVNHNISLNFISAEAFNEALASWSRPSVFALVTLHETCNVVDQRGAWMITAVRGLQHVQQITLQATPIPLRDIGASFHLSHTATEDAISSWAPAGSLDKRLDKVLDFGHDFDLNPRQRLFPADKTLLQSRSFDPAINANNTELINANNAELISLQDTGLQVFCVDCFSHSNFSLGLELEFKGLEVTHAHINLTVVEFAHQVQLEFSLNKTTVFRQAMDVLRAPVPGLGFEIPDIGSAGFFFGGTFSAEMDITGGLNFSIGAKAGIPAGAVAQFVMFGDEKSGATGWEPTFEIIPFRLNNGSFNASAQLSLSPFVDFEITALGSPLLEARIGLNTPEVTASATLLTNVNRDCQPVGPTDFESFTSALTFGAGASLNIQAQTKGLFVPDVNIPLFTQNISFGSIPAPSAPGCFIVADDTPTATAAGQVAPTGTLRAAAAAVPTFDLQKIEAYYSANGALPTNVNYTQLVQATAVPDDLKAAVSQVVGTNSNARPETKSGAPRGVDVGGFLLGGAVLLVLAGV